jgi:hypothetical protein
MTRNIALNLFALTTLLATLLIITVMPGSSIMDLDLDVGAKVLAIYVSYMAWALLSAILLGNIFTALWGSRGQARAQTLNARRS